MAIGRAGASDRPPPPPFEARLLVQILSLLAVGALGFAGFLLVVSPAQQTRTQEVLHDRLNEQLARAEAPLGGVIQPGTAVAILELSTIDLRQVVVEGTAGEQLAAGPGHRRTSPLPGQPGVCVIMGRSVTFGAPFERIVELRAGDEILATTGQGAFRYRVDGVRREGDPVPPPLAPGEEARLTLVTAEGSELFAAERTVFVDATQLDPVQSVPAQRPRVSLPEEEPLASNETSLFGLVLWLQALGLAAGMFTWFRYRWGRRETWLVGAPVLVAVGWNVAQTAATALLPNLL